MATKRKKAKAAPPPGPEPLDSMVYLSLLAAGDRGYDSGLKPDQCPETDPMRREAWLRGWKTKEKKIAMRKEWQDLQRATGAPDPRTPEALEPGGVGNIGESLIKLAQEAKAFREKWEDAAKAVKPGQCDTHKLSKELDVDASLHKSRESGNMVFIFKECAKCSHLLIGPPSWILKAGVPLELAEATLDNWQPRTERDSAILQVVKSFTARRMGFLILLGERGLGKTHLAVGVMNEFRCGKFITQIGLLTSLRRTYGDDRAPDVVSRCKKTPLLILDEMGLSTGGRDELPMLHDILNHRHGNFMPTVLTANATQAQFLEIIGDRMADRLQQSAFRWVTLAGTSMRPERKENYGERRQ